MNPTSIDQYARLGWFKPHGLWFCSGVEPTSATREYVPPHLGGGWFDYCCELATKQDGFDASSEWGQRVEWSQELRLDASKILQLRTEDDLLAFVREYGGTAPVGRPPWSSANAEMRDVVQRSSASVNVRNPRLERATAFGSGDIFLGDGLVWSAVARCRPAFRQTACFTRHSQRRTRGGGPSARPAAGSWSVRIDNCFTCSPNVRKSREWLRTTATLRA